MVILLGGGDGSASGKMDNSFQHDVPFLHRDISPYHRSLQRVLKKMTPIIQLKMENVLACAVSAMMGVGGRLLCTSYARINSVASIPPMKGIETSIYRSISHQHRTESPADGGADVRG